MTSILHIDQQLLLAFNGLHTPFLDQLVWNYTGHLPLLWLPLALLLAYLLIKDKRRDAIVLIFAIALLILLADQSSHLLKHLIARPRPTHTPSLLPQLHLVNDYLGGQYGHPSSHAANLFALALFTSLIIRHPLFITTIYTLATTFALTRIYLGVHYPSDVLFGALLGTLLALPLYYLTSFILQSLHARFPALFPTQQKENPRSTRSGFSLISVYIFSVGFVLTLLLFVLFSL